MDYVEVTIKQVADECGVSKSTAVRKLKELDLPVITRGGKGTVFLGPEAASALAHALVKAKTPESSPEEAAEAMGLVEPEPLTDPVEDMLREIKESVGEPGDGSPFSLESTALIESYRDQIKTLKNMNSVLQGQLTQSAQAVEQMRQGYEQTIDILNLQIERLHEQLAASQKEKDRLRDDLAIARALEGFHFPWQRDRIMAQYLLPAAHMAQAEDATYETPA